MRLRAAISALKGFMQNGEGMSVDVPFPENKIPLQGFVFIQAIFQKMAWINTKERQSAMSEIFKKTYTVAEPGCGLTVFSMEGSEINLFGSRTVIKTSGEDFFEPIKDFLHEKLVEEKADTMYYISMADTIVLGVLAGVAIVAGVVATFMSFGAATPLLGLGCVLAGAAISSYGYTKTLDSDRAAGRERSWAQFYLERTAGEFKGAAAGAVVFAGLLSGYELIGMAGGISSSIPSIVTAGTSGGTMAGAVEAAGLGEAVLGIGSMAALLAAAMKSGEGGKVEKGIEFWKQDKSGGDLSNYYQKGKKEVPAGSECTRRDTRNVKSEDFKDFIRSQGKSFKSNEWKKVMETWRTPDGRNVEVHYWKNIKTGDIWSHK